MIRPIALLPRFVNQTALSGPTVIPHGRSTPAAVKRSSIPSVSSRPIELLPVFVNQSAPSGPTVIPTGRLTPRSSPPADSRSTPAQPVPAGQTGDYDNQ